MSKQRTIYTDVKIVTHDKSSQEAQIRVFNDGTFSARISATCKVFEQRNPWWDKEKTATREEYPLPWDDMPTATRRILTGTNGVLQIARILPYGETNIPTMNVLRLVPGQCSTWHTNDRVDGKPTPEWELLVTIYRHGWFRKKAVAVESYLLKGTDENGKFGMSLTRTVRFVK